MWNGPASISLPHVAQGAARITIVDVRALLRRRARRHAARIIVTSMMFLALLPAALPFDHLFMRESRAEAAAQEAVHASHCHLSPGTCSDAPVPSGPGQLLLFQPLVVIPAMFSVLVSLAILILRGISVAPERRPPLRTASVAQSQQRGRTER